MSSGGPEEVACCTLGRLEACREPLPTRRDGPAPREGFQLFIALYVDSGLLLAAALSEGQASTPQRLLSKLGRGSSLLCVEPGRGEAGRLLRPKMKLLGHPSAPFSLVNGFSLLNGILRC